MHLDIEVYQAGTGDGQFVATCNDLELHSCGPTAARAIARLEAVIRFYLTAAPEYGITPERLNSISSEKRKKPDFYLPGRPQAGFLN